jgi:hypothetical protein
LRNLARLNHLWAGFRFFAVFGELGGVASLTARSYLHSPTGDSPETRRSTSVS